MSAQKTDFDQFALQAKSPFDGKNACGPALFSGPLDEASRQALAAAGQGVVLFYAAEPGKDAVLACLSAGDLSRAVKEAVPETGRCIFTHWSAFFPAKGHPADTVKAQWQACLTQSGAVLLNSNESTTTTMLPAAFAELCQQNGLTSEGLARHALTALPALAGHYTLGHRGARARMLAHEDGYTVAAGSLCSPADPTPGFTSVLRDLCRALVDRGDLVHRGGVWVFARDTTFASAIVAASILTRSAGRAAHWEKVGEAPDGHAR